MNVAPGWYPDPQGGQFLRWWDGYRWTAATETTASSARPFQFPAPDTKAAIRQKLEAESAARSRAKQACIGLGIVLIVQVGFASLMFALMNHWKPTDDSDSIPTSFIFGWVFSLFEILAVLGILVYFTVRLLMWLYKSLDFANAAGITKYPALLAALGILVPWGNMVIVPLPGIFNVEKGSRPRTLATIATVIYLVISLSRLVLSFAGLFFPTSFDSIMIASFAIIVLGGIAFLAIVYKYIDAAYENHEQVHARLASQKPLA